MQLLIFTGVLLACFSSLFIGAFISYNAQEELSAGRKYFIMLKAFTLSIAVYLLLWILEFEAYLRVLGSLAVLALVLHFDGQMHTAQNVKKQAAKQYLIKVNNENYAFSDMLNIIEYTCLGIILSYASFKAGLNMFALIAGIIFLCGFPIAGIEADNFFNKKINKRKKREESVKEKSFMRFAGRIFMKYWYFLAACISAYILITYILVIIT